jgi:hypothetical protein
VDCSANLTVTTDLVVSVVRAQFLMAVNHLNSDDFFAFDGILIGLARSPFETEANSANGDFEGASANDRTKSHPQLKVRDLFPLQTRPLMDATPHQPAGAA